MTEARDEPLCSEIHKLKNSAWSKEEMSQQWKDSIIPVYKRGNKTDCSNYGGIPLLSNSYKILSNILLQFLIYSHNTGLVFCHCICSHTVPI
jgi:hypothetical protein